MHPEVNPFWFIISLQYDRATLIYYLLVAFQGTN